MDITAAQHNTEASIGLKTTKKAISFAEPEDFYAQAKSSHLNFAQ